MTRQTGEKIVYRGFSPAFREKQSAQATLSAVEQAAPSDAAVRIQLDASQGRFEGKLVVASSAGQFRSVGTENSLEALLTQLSSDVFAQLSDWKRDRFSIDAG